MGERVHPGRMESRVNGYGLSTWLGIALIIAAKDLMDSNLLVRISANIAILFAARMMYEYGRTARPKGEGRPC